MPFGGSGHIWISWAENLVVVGAAAPRAERGHKHEEASEEADNNNNNIPLSFKARVHTGVTVRLPRSSRTSQLTTVAQTRRRDDGFWRHAAGFKGTRLARAAGGSAAARRCCPHRRCVPCVHVCVRACVRVCVCACARARVCVCVCVRHVERRVLSCRRSCF